MAWARRPAEPSQAGPGTGHRVRRTRQKQPLLSGAPAVIKGGWPGFLILFFGDLVTLPLGRGSGLVLYWVALIAYAVAGNRAATASIRSAPRAARDGALAAAFAFLLTVPLRFAAHAAADTVTVLALLVQVSAALIVGGLAGAIVARARRKLGRIPEEP